jgi:hypothetical protein
MPSGNKRLLLLLRHLSSESFGAVPSGTGLKTAIVAREMGLIEWEGTKLDWTYRLTEAGLRYRRENK